MGGSLFTYVCKPRATSAIDAAASAGINKDHRPVVFKGLSLNDESSAAMESLSPPDVLDWGGTAMRFDHLPTECRGAGIKVALIDSGIATSHKQLARIDHGIDLRSAMLMEDIFDQILEIFGRHGNIVDVRQKAELSHRLTYDTVGHQ